MGLSKLASRGHADQPGRPGNALDIRTVYPGMIAHGVARDEVAGVVQGRRPTGREGLATDVVLHAALEAARPPTPLAALLVEVPEEVHARLGPHNRREQGARGAPAPAGGADAVQDAVSRSMGQQHVQALGHLAEDVPPAAGGLPSLRSGPVRAGVAELVGAAVPLPRAPRAAEQPHALQGDLLLAQHSAVLKLLLHEVGVHGPLRIEVAGFDELQGAPPVMVAWDDHNVPVPRPDLPQPPIKVGDLCVAAVVGEVARVHEDVSFRQREARLNGPVHAVRVAEVHDANQARLKQSGWSMADALGPEGHAEDLPANVCGKA
mmetsp:Transcript_91953/g.268904  ORF Transcript_91953/g.268904 Transcript_91953/m.268904 type:complete len:320 (-) Transcript_91953:532-1491(-)